MPNRSTPDEREKLDHSAHPTTHRIEADLRSPGVDAGAKSLATPGVGLDNRGVPPMPRIHDHPVEHPS
jgi:hypothetical protein